MRVLDAEEIESLVPSNDSHVVQDALELGLQPRGVTDDSSECDAPPVVIATEETVDAHLPRASVATIALNTWLYMATPMSMPATVAVAGATWSGIFFTYSALSTYWTGRVLGRAFLVDPTCTTYGKMTGKAVSRVMMRRGVDESVVARWEPKVELWTLCLQFVTYYLDAVVQVVYIAEYLGQMLPRVELCSAVWAIIVGVLALPVVQIPTMHDSGRVVWLPCVCVSVAIIVFFGEIARVRPWEKCDPGPTYGKIVTPTSVFNSLGNFAYAFGGHGLYPEELREMKNPEQWPTVLNWTYSTMVPIYIAVMYWGYKAYGDFAKGNININFPRNAANMVSMFMQSVQCYYGVFYTNIALMMRLETALGVDPTTSWDVITKWGVAPAIFRALFRTTFLASEVFIAAIFLAKSGDVILNLQGLAGSIGMTAMTYFLPSVIHYAFNMHDGSSRLEKTWVLLNFLMGVFIMASGMYGSLSSLVQSELVNQCPVTYVYSPHDPADPCFISGIK